MIISDFLFLSIEADSLADDNRLGTCGAPDRERHFEADSQDALTCFTGTRAEGMFTSELVGGCSTIMLWRDITSHVWGLSAYVHTICTNDQLTEALHLGYDVQVYRSISQAYSDKPDNFTDSIHRHEFPASKKCCIMCV